MSWFWPLMPHQKRFHNGRGTFPTFHQWVELLFLPYFCTSAYLEAMGASVANISSIMMPCFRDKSEQSMCNSPQRPWVTLCGHFNWAPVRRASLSTPAMSLVHSPQSPYWEEDALMASAWLALRNSIVPHSPGEVVLKIQLHEEDSLPATSPWPWEFCKSIPNYGSIHSLHQWLNEAGAHHILQV